MSAESNARDHAQSFRWWVGNPEMTDGEAYLQDLLAPFRATKELICEQRDAMLYADADLFGGDEEPFA